MATNAQSLSYVLQQATQAPATPNTIGNVANAASIAKGWTQYISGPSWINAGVTVALSGIGSLMGVLSAQSLYRMYRENAELAVENAQIQASRLEVRGKIALANLNAQHAITEGQNELGAAASGAGALSGSLLDKLMANKKYNSREEYAQTLENIWAVSNAKREGYIQAYNTASQALAKAREQGANAWLGLVNGLVKATSSLAHDVTEGKRLDAAAAIKASEIQHERWKVLQYYGAPSLTDKGADTSGSIVTQGINGVALGDPTAKSPSSSWGFSNIDLYNLDPNGTSTYAPRPTQI